MSLLDRFKIEFWKFFAFFYRLLLQWRGLKVGKDCFIDGMPIFRRVKGSRVTLGDQVTLISIPRHNPLLTHPVTLKTITPHAVLEIKAHAGISGAKLVCCNRITVGEYTIIGPDTLIYDSEGHHYSPETGWISRRVRTGNPITIGSKCFIGTRCIILSGVTIGDNCVIAAGSVITHDVPSGYKASGNPATLTPLPKVLGGVGRRPKKTSEKC